MYARHTPNGPSELRNNIEAEKANGGKPGTHSQSENSSSSSAGSETVVNYDTKKKLALSEKLRTVLTTQSGLSQEAFSRIWDESSRDSGNA